MAQTLRVDLLRPCRPATLAFSRCSTPINVPRSRNHCVRRLCAQEAVASSSQHATLRPTPRSRIVARSGAVPIATEDDIVRVAAVGDLVTVHFTCTSGDGEVLESSYEVNEPLVFEVGAGDMMGNKLFQGFDEAVRGLAVGQKTVLEASGGEWRQELLFTVPMDHPEVARLQGRYKNHGGLHKGLIVELANNSMAMVIDIDANGVKIDANNMMAGKMLIFELEVIEIELAPPKEDA